MKSSSNSSSSSGKARIASGGAQSGSTSVCVLSIHQYFDSFLYIWAPGIGRSVSMQTNQIRGLEWDPFCPNNLATGGGDGMVKVWSIPAGGLQEDLTAPLVSINTGETASRSARLDFPNRTPSPIVIHSSRAGSFYIHVR